MKAWRLDLSAPFIPAFAPPVLEDLAMRFHPAAIRRRWLQCLAVLAVLVAMAPTLLAADEPEGPESRPERRIAEGRRRTRGGRGEGPRGRGQGPALHRRHPDRPVARQRRDRERGRAGGDRGPRRRQARPEGHLRHPRRQDPRGRQPRHLQGRRRRSDADHRQGQVPVRRVGQVRPISSPARGASPWDIPWATSRAARPSSASAASSTSRNASCRPTAR